MPCPGNTADGCRCAEHHPGLLATSSDPDALEAFLAPLRETRLRVVTPGPELDDPCDGTMLCGCKPCIKERVSRRPREVRQPWDARPGRRAA